MSKSLRNALVWGFLIVAGLFSTGSPIWAGLNDPEITYNVLLIIKPQTSVPERKSGETTLPAITADMKKEDIEAVTLAFKQHFPDLVNVLTDGRVHLQATVEVSDEPLSSLTPRKGDQVWPAPADVRGDLARFAPVGHYDSVFIYWRASSAPQAVGWGAGPQFQPAQGMGYATIHYDAPEKWKWDAEGPELLVHEWIHQLENFYDSEELFPDKKIQIPQPVKDGDVVKQEGYLHANGILLDVKDLTKITDDKVGYVGYAKYPSVQDARNDPTYEARWNAAGTLPLTDASLKPRTEPAVPGYPNPLPDGWKYGWSKLWYRAYLNGRVPESARRSDSGRLPGFTGLGSPAWKMGTIRQYLQYNLSMDVQNPSIEKPANETDDDFPWEFTSSYEGKEEETLASLDTNTFHESSLFWQGKGSLRVSIPANKPAAAALYQHVTLVPRQIYVLSGWVRTNDLQIRTPGGRVGVCLTAVVGDKLLPIENRAFQQAERRPPLALRGSLIGTNEWTYLVQTFDSGESGKATIFCTAGWTDSLVSGTVWFDDIALFGVEQSPAATLEDQKKGFRILNVGEDPYRAERMHFPCTDFFGKNVNFEPK